MNNRESGDPAADATGTQAGSTAPLPPAATTGGGGTAATQPSSATSGSCETPPNIEPGYSYYQTRHKLYWCLLKDPDATANLSTLSSAFKDFDPDDPVSVNFVRGVIAGFCNEDPGFSIQQLTALRDILRKTRPMSPLYSADTDQAKQARIFWRAAVGGPVSRFDLALSPAVHRYRAEHNATALAALRDRIAEMKVNSQDGPPVLSEGANSQIEDLVDIDVENETFSNLTWWDAAHDAW